MFIFHLIRDVEPIEPKKNKKSKKHVQIMEVYEPEDVDEPENVFIERQLADRVKIATDPSKILAILAAEPPEKTANQQKSPTITSLLRMHQNGGTTLKNDISQMKKSEKTSSIFGLDKDNVYTYIPGKKSKSPSTHSILKGLSSISLDKQKSEQQTEFGRINSTRIPRSDNTTFPLVNSNKLNTILKRNQSKSSQIHTGLIEQFSANNISTIQDTNASNVAKPAKKKRTQPSITVQTTSDKDDVTEDGIKIKKKKKDTNFEFNIDIQL